MMASFRAETALAFATSAAELRECCTYTTAKAELWPWLSGKSSLQCPFCARKRTCIIASVLAEFALAFATSSNMALIGQPRPDSGLGFQVKVLKPFLHSEADLHDRECPGRVRACLRGERRLLLEVRL